MWVRALRDAGLIVGVGFGFWVGLVVVSWVFADLACFCGSLLVLGVCW